MHPRHPLALAPLGVAPLCIAVTAAMLAGGAPPLAAQGMSAEARTAEICGPRLSCTVVRIHPAGTGASGRPLAVAEVRLGVGDKPEDAPEDGCHNGNERDGGLEYWVLRGDAPAHRLLALCNDGYGASGVGEDDVMIGDNRLEHFQSGGSAWRWVENSIYRLDPLVLERQSGCSFHTMTPASGRLTEIDMAGLRGRTVAFDAAHEENRDTIGCPDAMPRPLSAPRPGPGLLAAHRLVLPGFRSLPPRARWVPSGGTLGDCALPLTTDGKNGFLVYGKPAAQPAELRVIADSPTGLLLQVHEPRAPATKAQSWVHRPHVEIWRATGMSSEDGASPDPSRLEQIGIDLDGEIHRGIGAQAARLPDVERWTGKDERGRPVVVLRVSWPVDDALAWGVAVAYSQPENGRQARLVASTGIERNRPLFLPELLNVEPGCSMEGGLWRIEPPRPLDAPKS